MFSILVKGGVLMIPIIIASVVSMTLMIERFFYWRRHRSKPHPLEAIRLIEDGKTDEALRLSSSANSPIMRVIKAGLENRGHEPSLAMEAEAISEIKEMNRFLPALDTIITLAPLLGLLGTIIGMIGSFGVISEAGLNRPLAVTGGISEALIATAAGIVVAVATLIPYNFFIARTEKTAGEIEKYATRVELALFKSAAIERDRLRVPVINQPCHENLSGLP